MCPAEIRTDDINAAATLRDAKTIVVKLGSSLLWQGSDQAVQFDLHKFSEDLAQYHLAGKRVIIVSSGAVAHGRQYLPEADVQLVSRQALSAIGQIDLMAKWKAALGEVGLLAAQVLLTPDITESRRRYLTARSTLRTLLSYGVIPVINENDVVAIEELRYGDNDRLAAITAGLIDADVLVLLTDVEGLYTENPLKYADASFIPVASQDTLTRLQENDLSSTSQVGTGGMASKIEAAKMAHAWGVPVILASGKVSSPLSSIENNARKATLIPAATRKSSARRRWLEGLTVNRGEIYIDAGAEKALLNGHSLLPVGVTETITAFLEGDIVLIKGPSGHVGFGLARMNSTHMGEKPNKPVIHRDDLVIERRT